MKDETIETAPEPFTDEELKEHAEARIERRQALTVRDAVAAVERLPAPEVKPQVTAAQAKVEAVANLTFKAYERAATLQLTPEESKALQADFPDEAFKPGAAGKENLIYIEHAFLRDRLNEVIGIGQWALIPRNRWGEDFTTFKGVQATRIYVEAMLVVRGAFVSEAVGEMEYYPKNAAQNYGDAVEGAKTAALRRCCKEFGIGLQAWKKDWCEGWWQRRRSASQKPLTKPTPPPQTKQPVPPPQQQEAPSEKTYPCVEVLSVQEAHSKPDAPKKWTAYFIKFSDGFAHLEAATFDKKIADLANELANTQESAVLRTKPGRKPGTNEIVSLERSEQPGEPGDQEPPNFDEHEPEVAP